MLKSQRKHVRFPKLVVFNTLIGWNCVPSIFSDNALIIWEIQKLALHACRIRSLLRYLVEKYWTEQIWNSASQKFITNWARLSLLLSSYKNNECGKSNCHEIEQINYKSRVQILTGQSVGQVFADGILYFGRAIKFLTYSCMQLCYARMFRLLPVILPPQFHLHNLQKPYHVDTVVVCMFGCELFL